MNKDNIAYIFFLLNFFDCYQVQFFHSEKPNNSMLCNKGRMTVLSKELESPASIRAS